MSPQILSVNMVLQGKVATIISVYGSQSGRNKEEKEKFHDDLRLKCNQETGKDLFWNILIVMLEVLPIDRIEFMVAMDMENAREMTKGF